jgi:hypothetical protein
MSQKLSAAPLSLHVQLACGKKKKQKENYEKNVWL